MKPDPASPLPRSPRSADGLVHLREEALRLREMEERADFGVSTPTSAPGGRSSTRRRTLLGILLVPIGVAAGILTRGLGRSRIVELVYARTSDPEPQQSRPPAPVYGGPPPPPPPQPPFQQQKDGQVSVIGSIQTQNGHFLTAINGGGLGDPFSAPDGVALSTGATRARRLERFQLVWVDRSAGTFALRTVDKHFVTAAGGGGIGGPNSELSPIHTDSKTKGPWDQFRITLLYNGEIPLNYVTIQTPDGEHYLSAVNGGGVGGSTSDAPIRTDATSIGPAEVFRIIPTDPSKVNP